ncbi:alpha/beta fold hydrolase [Gracilibacillus caseinilyticus]|uniref:Alpha/beta fold hydrolase n=1 Tax=Gracilibacillus caseinilyticus TaxID=2932256 RepID=A0ABY4EVU3_9BACI|nr:alpha/beta fold hydrolase [Gracilibacillus caseinilyticus]UOQ48520.1 alpha/beta fold hydrolase [Gracilibacillus caseinilyticus]
MHFYTTNDGYRHFYQKYPAKSSNNIMILLHGISENHRYLAPLASYIAKRNIATVLTPDLRGYGEFCPKKGDVDYIGQHEDDLKQFITQLKKDYQESRFILAGHSAGGGSLLRLSETDLAETFDLFILLAPLIHYGAPTIPKENTGFRRAIRNNLSSILALNDQNITKLNDRIVFENQKPENLRHGSETISLSFRLFASRYPVHYLNAIENLTKPTLLIAGKEDEQFVASAYEPLFQDNPHVDVMILEDIDHDGILSDRHALSIIGQWIQNTIIEV